MVDIKMDSEWQLTPSASGDAPLTDDEEGLLQVIRTESITQEGELFYDTDFGWSLLDFAHVQESDIVKIEIESRIKKKLAKYEEILPETVSVKQIWKSDTVGITAYFKLDSGTEHTIEVNLSRIEVEVI